MNIVSLVPSITETLLAWGVTPIAVTRFCEQPSLPHVGGTKDPDVARIIELRPDLVLLNDQENRVEDHDALVAAGIDVHVVRIDALADVAPALGDLAARVDVDAPAVELPSPKAVDLAAFVPIWKRPWMTIGDGTYGSSVLAHLGVANIFAGDGAYPETTLDAAAARRPDVVIAPSEPYPFAERHRAQLEAVAPAVFVDGQDLFWWGARTASAVRRLDGLLNKYRAQ